MLVDEARLEASGDYTPPETPARCWRSRVSSSRSGSTASRCGGSSPAPRAHRRARRPSKRRTRCCSVAWSWAQKQGRRRCRRSSTSTSASAWARAGVGRGQGRRRGQDAEGAAALAQPHSGEPALRVLGGARRARGSGDVSGRREHGAVRGASDLGCRVPALARLAAARAAAHGAARSRSSVPNDAPPHGVSVGDRSGALRQEHAVAAPRRNARGLRGRVDRPRSRLGLVRTGSDLRRSHAGRAERRGTCRVLCRGSGDRRRDRRSARRHRRRRGGGGRSDAPANRADLEPGRARGKRRRVQRHLGVGAARAHQGADRRRRHDPVR